MKHKNNKWSYKTFLPILLAGCTAFGMLIGHRFSSENLVTPKVDRSGLTSKNDDGLALQEIIRYIENRYVDSLQSGKLVDIAANSILQELDPHSIYISPEELSQVNEGMSGYYKGMGIETIHLDDTLRITKVLSNSPAEKAGLNYEDKIISVNDSLLTGDNKTREEKWQMLKTVDQESFILGILDQNSVFRKTEVFPSKIKAPNVEFLKSNDIAYINILRFSDETYEGLIDALENIQTDNTIKNLILDLRNNPGGYLPEATKILNQFFVEDKKLLVYTEDRNNRKSEYNSTGRPFYEIDKLAVLINEGSASASEIIAGALQDWDKAILIGESTFGKGLVQEQFNLSNGGALRLTTAKYYTPSGRSIQKPYKEQFRDSTSTYFTKKYSRKLNSNGGVNPDISISWSEEESKLINELSSDITGISYKIIQKLGGKEKVENIQSDKISDQIMEYLKSNHNVSYNQLDFASNYILYHIYLQLDNRDYFAKVLFNHDIFINEAISQLNKKDIFADLLEVN